MGRFALSDLNCFIVTFLLYLLNQTENEMAQITKEDLEHLTSDEIRNFFTDDDSTLSKQPSVIRNYVLKGKENFTMGNRFCRIEHLLTTIITERFINKTL